MTLLNDITAGFRDALNAINQTRNIKLGAQLSPLFSGDIRGNETDRANAALTIVGPEILDRAAEVRAAFEDEIEGHMTRLSEGELLTLKERFPLSLRDCLNQVRNELFRYYEPISRNGGPDDGYIVAVLSEGVNRAEGAAFTEANRRLKRLFRNAGVDFEASPKPALVTSNSALPIAVFVDANLFLQYRDLKDLQWKQMLPGHDWIEIAVAKVIVEELEHHKNSPIKRRRNRSRDALKRIGEAPKSEGGRLELRADHPKVTLRFVRTVSHDPQKISTLDLSHNDDRLVAAFIGGLSSGPCKLMTDDSGPRLTAYDLGYGIDVIEPDEGWRLSEEPDSESQKVKELTQENALLKSTRPDIAIDCPPVVEWVVPDLAPLAPEFVEDLLVRFLGKHPRERLPHVRPNPTDMAAFHSGFSQHDLDTYTRAYERFEKDARTYFETLHLAAKRYAIVASIPIALTNRNHNTAHKLIFEISTGSGATIIGNSKSADELRGDLKPPKPPKPPKSIYEGVDRPLLDLSAFQRQREEPRNPTAFFWQPIPKARARSGSLICEEFRADEAFEIDILVAFDLIDASVQKIDIKVSATNLLAPLTTTCEIRVQPGPLTWDDPRVEHYLPPKFYRLTCPQKSPETEGVEAILRSPPA